MRGRSVARVAALALSSLMAAAATTAQPVPRPFPKPGEPPPTPPEQAAPAAQTRQPAPGEPTEAELGLPVYPGADYLTSFDAGMGQRYHLFGTNTPFPDIVNYYRIVLKTRGNLIFDQPATHTFEIGRFREETMAFPPGVTVKDYTWSGSEGYLHVRGTEGARYRTVIQIVPVLPGSR